MKFKQDKGVAGLTILLSVVVMLFIIGLVVMIFALMSSEMSIATYTSTTVTVTDEVLTTVSEAGEDLAGASYRDASCSLTTVLNDTDAVAIGSTNYTLTGCSLASASGGAFNNTDWIVNYTYTYNADNTGTDVINDTSSAISGVTDWFDIFIVIGAMVVLILLTVIIITAIRSSGMVAEAGSTNNVGTA